MTCLMFLLTWLNDDRNADSKIKDRCGKHYSHAQRRKTNSKQANEGGDRENTIERQLSAKCLVKAESAYLSPGCTLQAEFPLKIMLIRNILPSYCGEVLRMGKNPCAGMSDFPFPRV